MTTQGVPTPGPSALGGGGRDGDGQRGGEQGEGAQDKGAWAGEVHRSPIEGQADVPAHHRRLEPSGAGHTVSMPRRARSREIAEAPDRDVIGRFGPACGQGRGRTADLPIFSRSLVPTELPGQARGMLHERRGHRGIGRAADSVSPGGADRSSFTGSSTQKAEPPPGVDSAPTVPPSRSAIWRDNDRPRPVPLTVGFA